MYSVETAGSVDTLKKTVEEYSVSNKARVDTLVARNQEIKTSEDNFKALLDNLMRSYKSHSDLVQTSTKRIKETVDEDLTSVAKLVERSEEVATQVQDKKTKTLITMEAEQERISGYVKDTVTKCQDINQDILVKKETLESSVKSHVETTTENWVVYKQQTEAKTEEHKAKVDEKQNLFKKEMEENRSKLNTIRVSIEKEIETAKDTDEASVLKLATKVETMGDKCDSVMLEEQTRIRMEKELATSFVSDVLRVDQPTGVTPARTVRSFPRYLEATSPHERILHRYRAQAETAVVAARLPLEDSDNEDSLMSTSNPTLSRESSDVEIKVKRKSPVEGLSRQNSEVIISC